MQPVNDSSFQHRVIPAQQKISVNREPSPNSVKTHPHRDTLPEDIVTLSTDRSRLLDPSAKKDPSVPVTPAESKALRDIFSVYA
ncbi:MAG TPA: hypothetical protein VN642_04705 [Dongiaceae bacterium]|nr:hypothetical protein [Dongiaceae bacterium]